MASRSEWAQRVADWRASGMKATEFCLGRGFSAAALREWSCRLRKAEPTKLQLVRVERTEGTTVVGPPTSSATATSLTIEISGARVLVTRGCDSSTLRTVLEVLASVAGETR